MNHPLALAGRTAVHQRLLRRAASLELGGRSMPFFGSDRLLRLRPAVPLGERCGCFTTTSSRAMTSAPATGGGPTPPVVAASSNNEAARKHRELQSLLHGESSATTTAADPKNPMLQQRLRQAIINAALGFFVVVLAMQGVKHGHELRKAQQLQQQAQDELEQARRLLRSLVAEDAEDDASLRDAARDVLRAAASSSSSSSSSSDASVPVPSGWWQRIGGVLGLRIVAPPPVSDIDPDPAAVDRAVQVLRDHLSSRIGVVVQSSAEREVEALRLLAAAASAATTPTTTATTEGDSAAIGGVVVGAAAKDTGEGATAMPAAPPKERVFVL